MRLWQWIFMTFRELICVILLTCFMSWSYADIRVFHGILSTIQNGQASCTKVMSRRWTRKGRVIFMEEHIPIRPDRILLLGRQTSTWSLWDVVFHENNTKPLSTFIYTVWIPKTWIRVAIINISFAIGSSITKSRDGNGTKEF